jgi:hypothetical protein
MAIPTKGYIPVLAPAKVVKVEETVVKKVEPDKKEEPVKTDRELLDEPVKKAPEMKSDTEEIKKDTPAPEKKIEPEKKDSLDAPEKKDTPEKKTDTPEVKKDAQKKTIQKKLSSR